MNDNKNIFPTGTGTSIPSDHNSYHQHMSNNTSNNSFPNNNNQRPIFNDTSNNQNYQQQYMPSNGSTPQFNSQYINPNPLQSNDFLRLILLVRLL